MWFGIVMRHEIVEKLRPLFERPFETEERVVYVMVEVRKLMAHTVGGAELPRRFPKLCVVGGRRLPIRTDKRACDL